MRRECMGPIAAYFPVQAFGWGSCWMFHWLFAGLGFSWQPFVIPLSSYSGGVEGKPRMPSWSSWQTVLASALATKWFRFFCSWEQCPIPGVVDMWDRQILSRPHLPTIPKGDSLPWISIIHGAKDSVKNPKNGSVSHRFRKFDAPIFVCPSTVCWHWCHKPSEITIKKSLTIPYSTRFVLELESERTSPARMILFKFMNICSYKFMFDCIYSNSNKQQQKDRRIILEL